MSQVNPSTVNKVGNAWVLDREVAKDALPSVVQQMRDAKAILDTIQDKFGTIQTADPQWTAMTEAQREESLRKGVVALSEILEQQLKLLVFLTGQVVDK